MDLYNTVLAIFCDPEGNPCMAGSDGDREALKHALYSHRQALQSQAEIERVMKLMAEALRRYCQGRNSSDTEYAREALSEYHKLGGTQDE